MFQDGSFKTISSTKSLALELNNAWTNKSTCCLANRYGMATLVANTSQSQVPFQTASIKATSCPSSTVLYSAPKTKVDSRLGLNTGLNRFPFNNFTYYLTLFSKFFSSFPHGTCSLSVSCQYLALDEIYHPIRAVIPNNSTLWKRNTMYTDKDHKRDSHPLWCHVPKNLCQCLIRLTPL